MASTTTTDLRNTAKQAHEAASIATRNAEDALRTLQDALKAQEETREACIADGILDLVDRMRAEAADPEVAKTVLLQMIQTELTSAYMRGRNDARDLGRFA